MADTVKVTLDAPPGVPKVTVEAEAYGRWWAVTPCWGSTFQLDPRYLAVTHIPSGRAVGSYAFHNHDLVRQLAQKFAELFDGEEWGHQDHLEIPEEARAEAAAVYVEWVQDHAAELGQHHMLGWN